MGNVINTNFMNTDLLPLEVSDSPWLHENLDSEGVSIGENTGKWMLFYDKSSMNEVWISAKKLYRENKLYGIKSMKCSTAYENPRASTLDDGIIILYCNNSSNEEEIMNIGKKILEMFNYKEHKIIYYKTDLQTHKGTNATGSNKNHTYKLINPLYKDKCSIKKPFLQVEKGICVCGKKCGIFPRCLSCEIEYKETLPYTCKCGVKSKYKCCYKCNQLKA
jgi:hypothetical protein